MTDVTSRHSATGGPPPRPVSTSTSTSMATTALVLAIIPAVFTWIVAIVLAVVVLRQSKDGRARGKRRAITALIVACTWIGLAAIVIALTMIGRADRDDSGTITNAGSMPVSDLRVGDCVANDLGGSDDDIDLEPCSRPHRLEIYAQFELAPGYFPGVENLNQSSEGGCLDRFESFVGSSWDDTDLEVHFLRPTTESDWERDREVSCLVTTGDDSTGSLKGSKR